MAETITVGMKRVLTATPNGRIDGVPVWTASDTTGPVQLFPTPDGRSCDVVAVVANVSVTITVTADANLGTGVVNITASVDIQTLEPAATAIALTVGPEQSL